MTLLSLGDVAVEFGATTLFEKITFTVSAGERWGIIGRNGTGKTTLFKLITGAMQPTRGSIAKVGDARVSLLEQHRDFGAVTTVWEAAAGPFAELLTLEASLAEQAAGLAEDASEAALDRYARDLERFERQGGYTFAPRVDAVLQGLGFDPTAARTQLVATLSGGERGRVGLVRQLVSPADVILLDEPTNHLDLETTRWLENHLRSTQQTVLLISHDRAFMAAVIDHVLHVENGTAYAYNGGYEEFLLQRAERRLTQQRQFEKQQSFIAKEQDYINRNIAGQNSKQAKGRRKRLDRLPRMGGVEGDEGVMSLRLEAGERGGDQVMVAERATISIGERVLVKDFSGVIRRNDVVGLVGPNGAGKSTLIKTLLGERAPASGRLVVGSSITPAYYRQDLAQLPLESTLYDVIANLRPLWERRVVQGHLGRFGFSGDEVQRKVQSLSGGERARLALAGMMLTRANFLILDEPTNHLDVESIEAIEDAIEAYEGTVLVVSHDRELLRALTTRMWVLHDRHITDFDGSFGEWEQVSAERLHAASVRAQEEEALRRVHEKQKTQRQTSSTDGTRKERRRLERDAQQAEEQVLHLEDEVARITKTLEDPELYTTDGGIARGRELGVTLDARKKELDRAIERWTQATDALEAHEG